ncbi:MAG TPA: nitroreductase family protein, partial [Paracoccaceae bacterium]|nr:nitroreductase family protein [Paracoccaceae bacterium]
MYFRDQVTYKPLPLPDRADLSDAEALAAAEAFLDHLKKRHTVRDFAPTPVPREIIAACVAAAGSAPSGANHQPWFFVAIADPAMKAKIRAAAEAEEEAFYAGGAGDEWLKALEP